MNVYQNHRKNMIKYVNAIVKLVSIPGFAYLTYDKLQLNEYSKAIFFAIFFIIAVYITIKDNTKLNSTNTTEL